MIVLFVLIVLLCAIGVFLAFDMSLDDFDAYLNSIGKKKTLKQLREKKVGTIEKRIADIKNMLAATNRANKFTFIVLLCIACMAGGCVIGSFTNNMFLIPVFGLACGVLPVIYIQIQYAEYQKVVAEQLSMALSSITTSYERCENIVEAIEDNIGIIEQPTRTFFEDFLTTVHRINPDVQKALITLKGKIDNVVFVEWCECLIKCVNDRTLKFSLQSIVSKFTKIAIHISKGNNIIREAKSNFFKMIIASLALLWAC